MDSNSCEGPPSSSSLFYFCGKICESNSMSPSPSLSFKADCLDGEFLPLSMVFGIFSSMSKLGGVAEKGRIILCVGTGSAVELFSSSKERSRSGSS